MNFKIQEGEEAKWWLERLGAAGYFFADMLVDACGFAVKGVIFAGILWYWSLALIKALYLNGYLNL